MGTNRNGGRWIRLNVCRACRGCGNSLAPGRQVLVEDDRPFCDEDCADLLARYERRRR